MLISAVIPRPVKTVGDFAFDACHEITEVTIPATVTSPGRYVFSSCHALTSAVEAGITVLPETTFNNVKA